MGGELVVNVSAVKSDNWFVRPLNPDNPNNDLTMVDNEGKFLHICGENDWGYLAAELLKPILKTGNELYYDISSKIDDLDPEVVLVGKTEYRLIDILHIVRDSEQGITVIKGVPIVKGDFNNGIKYLGKKEMDYLPFV